MSLRRSIKERRNAILDDYIVFLQEHEDGIGLKKYDPINFYQAIRSFNSKKWIDAMKDDMNSMQDNNVWDLFELTTALLAHFDLELHHIDVKTVFLNGDIDEMIYMVIPKNFVLDDFKSMLALRHPTMGYGAKILLHYPINIYKSRLEVIQIKESMKSVERILSVWRMSTLSQTETTRTRSRIETLDSDKVELARTWTKSDYRGFNKQLVLSSLLEIMIPNQPRVLTTIVERSSIADRGFTQLLPHQLAGNMHVVDFRDFTFHNDHHGRTAMTLDLQLLDRRETLLKHHAPLREWNESVSVSWTRLRRDVAGQELLLGWLAK
ncbi:hypothetical protein CR513_37501, partial [Mucuna pruriens]